MTIEPHSTDANKKCIAMGCTVCVLKNLRQEEIWQEVMRIKIKEIRVGNLINKMLGKVEQRMTVEKTVGM